MMNKHFRVALAGNPNCGKTTIFNILTGSHQHVGNYSGVTVERKTGICHFKDAEIEIIDLPGIYSLSSSSPEERVAFRELWDSDIDLILNVIDAGNPQRNLYLTTQLAELDKPMLLVFNMADDALKKGIKFNLPILEHYFGAKIVRTVGATGRGIEIMKEVLLEQLEAEEKKYPAQLRYGELLDPAIADLTKKVSELPDTDFSRVPARYFAIKLLEGDPVFTKEQPFVRIMEEVETTRQQLADRLGVDMEALLPDCRYGMISGACREAIRLTNERRLQLSDNIDKFVTNRYAGVPIFLLVMLLIFTLTFLCASPFVDLLDFFFNGLANVVRNLWPEGHLEFVRDLIADGVIGGVGGVLTFLPNIVFLFLGIAFLEGTGYMARAAYVMDGFMHKFGLHGKSFIPMLLGFGCTVPAVLATRCIESEKDRLTTIMILPLMSCGARLPIYSLIIPAFFAPKYQALLLWSLYIIGVLIALGGARLLKSTLFKGGEEIYVMELPPYRMPTFRSLLLHMWERTTMYLKKAGTIILLASVILFILNSLPVKPSLKESYDAKVAAVEKQATGSAAKQEAVKDAVEKLRAQERAEALEYSCAGRIGRFLEKGLHPLGFDWRVSSALIGAFAAKELFVSQLGILFSVSKEDDVSIRDALKQVYTPLQAFCIMLFCLISIPCIGTVAVVRKETGSTTLMLLQFFGLFAIAYILTLAVYQIGSLMIRFF